MKPAMDPPHPMPPTPPAPPPGAVPPMDPEVAAVLREPAVLWDAVQATTHGSVAVIDAAGIIRWCNRVDGGDGISLDDVVGHSFVRFTVPESSAALTDMLRLVFADGMTRSLETTVRGPDGVFNYFLLRLAPLRLHGRIVAVMGCCESIRPLRNSEQALARERSVLRRLIEIQEQERQLVSYEIHDGLAQYLAGAIMHLEAHLHTLPDHKPRELVDGVRLVRAAAEEARRLIGGLRPPALDELGIVEAIESLVADARIEIPRVDFIHHLTEARLSPAVETAIFRIVQESLTNARRHAHADRATITVEQIPAGVHVRVADDGRGFEPTSIPESRFGLEGIRQRCRMFGVEPAIESAAGRGTVIDVVLPPALPAG